jgi:hypothetical protein
VGPGEEGEKYCVAREKADEGLELGAEVDWAVGSVSRSDAVSIISLTGGGKGC